MVKKAHSPRRREQSLSRDGIIEASIAILDSSGEDGLTFRILSERLATGPGALYWHIANKSELVTAACDAIVAATMNATLVGATPEATIRDLALAMFDAIDAHPWIGSALTRAPGELPIVRVLERIGQQVRRLGVSDKEQWATVGALLNYILGVAGQNAANARALASSKMDRSAFLAAVAERWAQLDPARYPSVHKAGTQLPEHDDREQFLAGIDLILVGIETVNSAAKNSSSR